MKNNYEYYLKYIKPIEKKYTKLCTIYSFFKLNYIKNRINFYNRILNIYYRNLKNNIDDIQEFKKHIK